MKEPTKVDPDLNNPLVKDEDNRIRLTACSMALDYVKAAGQANVAVPNKQLKEVINTFYEFLNQ